MRPATGPEAPGQYLFRLEVRTRDEHDTMRLTLRLWRPSRFEIVASDPFGRVAGTLEVSELGGRWKDRRHKESCRFDPKAGFVLAGLPIPLPAAALPRVLLGRLPVTPPAQTAGSVEPTVRHVEFRDERGAQWTFEIRNGEPRSWRLDEGGHAALTWNGSAMAGHMILGVGSVDLRWRQSARSALQAGPPAWETGPENEPDCAHDDVP